MIRGTFSAEELPFDDFPVDSDSRIMHRNPMQNLTCPRTRQPSAQIVLDTVRICIPFSRPGCPNSEYGETRFHQRIEKGIGASRKMKCRPSGDPEGSTCVRDYRQVERFSRKRFQSRIDFRLFGSVVRILRHIARIDKAVDDMNAQAAVPSNRIQVLPPRS